MIYGLLNNYAPLENNAPLAAPFQGIELLYSGIPSVRSKLDTIRIVQRIHRKIELKRWNKVRKVYKTKKPQCLLKFFIS